MPGLRAALLLGSCLVLPGCAGGAAVAPRALALDHVVVGVADLDAGVREIERRTGVRAASGGEHPGAGTHNALLALGGDRYLEIVAPRPGAQVPERLAYLGGLTAPTPVMWAVATRDIAAVDARLRANGYATTGPMPGSRRRPDGGELRWTTLAITQPPLAAAPFFIEWAPGTAHPAATSPGGCALESLRIVLPDPAPLRRLLELLELDVEVIAASQPALEVELRTPRGIVRL
jgi:hypothetical protein